MGGDLVSAVAAAVLVEVIGQLVQRPRPWPRGGMVGGWAGPLVAGGAGLDRDQNAGDTLTRPGDVVQNLLQPILAGLVPLGVGEVAGCGVGQQRQRQVQPGAEAAGVHGGVDQRFGGRHGLGIAGQQDWHPRQVLGDLTILGVLGGLTQAGIFAGQARQRIQGGPGERIRHADVVAVQQLPSVGMCIRVPAGAQGVPVVRPQGGKNQYRAALPVAQQLAQARGDLLTHLLRRQVQLGLVQPHHGVRRDVVEFGEGSVGAGGIDGMPQPPRLVGFPQQGEGFPTGAGLAGRGPADQHRDAAGPRGGGRHHLAQRPIMLARDVRRKLGQTGDRGIDRVVNLQVEPERVGHLGKRPARLELFQHSPSLRGLHRGTRAVGAAGRLGPMNTPPLLLMQQGGHRRVAGQPYPFGLHPHCTQHRQE